MKSTQLSFSLVIEDCCFFWQTFVHSKSQSKSSFSYFRQVFARFWCKNEHFLSLFPNACRHLSSACIIKCTHVSIHTKILKFIFYLNNSTDKCKSPTCCSNTDILIVCYFWINWPTLWELVLCLFFEPVKCTWPVQNSSNFWIIWSKFKDSQPRSQIVWQWPQFRRYKLWKFENEFFCIKVHWLWKCLGIIGCQM